jgi:prevent-host-death family protein
MRMEVDFTMTKRNKHIGWSLNNFLKEEGILEETRAIALKDAVARQVQQAMKKENIPTIGKDTHSLTTFCRRSGDLMKQLSKSKRPIVLTVQGKAAVVVQDAEAYQRLLDIAASADTEEGIRQGLDDVVHGRTRPAREFFSSLKEPNDSA